MVYVGYHNNCKTHKISSRPVHTRAAMRIRSGSARSHRKRMISMPYQCAGDFDAYSPSIQFRKLFTWSIITRLWYANHGHESCANQWRRKYTPFEQCSYQWLYRVRAQNRPRRNYGQLDKLVVYLQIRRVQGDNRFIFAACSQSSAILGVSVFIDYGD